MSGSRDVKLKLVRNHESIASGIGYPEICDQSLRFLAPGARHDPMSTFYHLGTSKDHNVRLAAAKS
jgi:hypothetical protein